LDKECIWPEDATMKWHFFFDGNMAARLAIKKDSPQFSKRILRMMIGAENGLADPES
jgi:hypothetical protein